MCLEEQIIKRLKRRRVGGGGGGGQWLGMERGKGEVDQEDAIV